MNKHYKQEQQVNIHNTVYYLEVNQAIWAIQFKDNPKIIQTVNSWRYSAQMMTLS